ncbi:MAG: substrate-binding domain-containing protein [Pedobacter sp.]|uniref:PstS family phosphate ABC transporter substrate-binding protein n=1 Tax=Pedobacter sp. TaxID=1411316 RepID=UPI003566236F
MLILRIFLTLLLITLVGFSGFAALFIINFGGGPAYATYITIAITIALIIFIILFSTKLMPRKTLYNGMGIFLGLCVLIIAGCQINKYRIDNIPVVNDELNLSPYEPFTKNTKAVDLGSPSSLKIDDHLPVMDGATALYPVYSAFARAVYPNKRYNHYNSDVMCTNTPNAYKNLVDGKADIIFVARPSKEQLDYARTKGIEMVLTPIGKEAFVFFVNSTNKVTGLQLDQIRKIYSGSITNWKELGGNSEAIKAFQRPEGSGSQTMLIHTMRGYKLTDPPTNNVAAGMGGIIKKTANYKNFGNAIGFSFLYFATGMIKNQEIRVLDIDNIPANSNTIRTGTYPLTTQFYAVTTNQAKPNTKKLLNWVLSGQGQSIIEKTGYVSLHTQPE